MRALRVSRARVFGVAFVGSALLLNSAWAGRAQADSDGAACLDQQGAFSAIQRITDFTEKTVFAITDQASKNAAATVLASRCAEHRSWWSNSSDCESASTHLIDDLDCPMMSGRPCFVHDFESLVNSPEVAGYMRDLHSELAYDRAAPPDKPFNLWDWTLAYTKGDRQKATQWLAVIFQDPNSAIIMGYFYRHPAQKPKYLSEFDVLANTFDDLGRKPTPWLQLLPKDLGVSGVGFYHFYAEAYLASRLENEMPSADGKKMALALPTLFNASYEYIYAHYDPKRPSTQLGRLIGEYEDSREPSSLNPSDPGQSHAIDASYEGYAGSAWGIGIPPSQLMSLDDFRKRFAASPHQFFDDLLR